MRTGAAAFGKRGATGLPRSAINHVSCANGPRRKELMAGLKRDRFASKEEPAKERSELSRPADFLSRDGGSGEVDPGGERSSGIGREIGSRDVPGRLEFPRARSAGRNRGSWARKVLGYDPTKPTILTILIPADRPEPSSTQIPGRASSNPAYLDRVVVRVRVHSSQAPDGADTPRVDRSGMSAREAQRGKRSVQSSWPREGAKIVEPYGGTTESADRPNDKRARTRKRPNDTVRGSLSEQSFRLVLRHCRACRDALLLRCLGSRRPREAFGERSEKKSGREPNLQLLRFAPALAPRPDHPPLSLREPQLRGEGWRGVARRGEPDEEAPVLGTGEEASPDVALDASSSTYLGSLAARTRHVDQRPRAEWHEATRRSRPRHGRTGRESGIAAGRLHLSPTEKENTLR
ncbi:hypothetical protein KM043_007339 [Ampulex compressa]|nr:hypothetical protein KM043_007339 [Ampulex compressa]